MIRKYDEKFQTVNDWVECINEYWIIYEGTLNNHKPFWDDVLHSMSDQDWSDVNDVADVLSRQYPEDFRKFGKFYDNLNELNRRCQLGKKVIKQYDRQHYNRPPFQVIMSVKDKINEINGRCISNSTKPKEPPPIEPQTAYAKRQARREANAAIQERLFDYD